MIRDASLVTKNSRISRLFVVVSFGLWALGLLGADLHVLTLSLDGIFVDWRLWSFVTAGLYEQYALSGLLSLAGLALAAPLLEKHWGTLRSLKFFLIVSSLSFVGVFGTLLFCWCLGLGSPQVLWHTPLSGLPGVLGGFSVALKQRFGDWRLAWGLRARHLPTALLASGLCILGLHLLASSGPETEAPTSLSVMADPAAGFVAGAPGARISPTELAVSASPSWLPYVVHWGPLLIMTWGIFFGWVYLRFYDRDDDQLTVGDLSPSFSLSSFVPECVAPSLAPLIETYIATPMYELCANKLHLFEAARRTSGLGLPLAGMGGGDLLPSTMGGMSRAPSRSTGPRGSPGVEFGGESPIGSSLIPGEMSMSSSSGGPLAPISALTDFSYDSLLLMDAGDFDDESFLQASDDPVSQRRLAVAIKAVDEKLALLAGGSLDDPSIMGTPAKMSSAGGISGGRTTMTRLAAAASKQVQQPPPPSSSSAPPLSRDGVLKLPPLPDSIDHLVQKQ